MGLWALRPSAAVVKVMSVPDSRCIRVVTPDDHVNIGFHELPFVATSELDYLRRIWPQALFAFMSRYQQDLERMRRECRERFGCTQSGNCTHCGKCVQRDLGRRIAFYHMELTQLWRCPVMWCTVWKGTAQDCIDHMQRIHKVPLSVKAANLARFFPPWTVAGEQLADVVMPSISGVAIDTLLFGRIGSPLCHRYRIISRTGSHTAFRGTYLRRLHVFLEESDSAVVRRLHHQLAQELAARIALPTVSPASVPSRSAVGHRTVSKTRRPRRLKGVTDSSGGPESVCRLPIEMSSVQALMDLSLHRFAGLTDGPRQIHPPWSIASDSPASPAPARLDTSLCHRRASTWICSHHHQRMIQRIRRNVVTCQLHCFVTQMRPIPVCILIRSSRLEIPQRNRYQRTSNSSSGGVPVCRAVSSGRSTV